MLTKGITSIRIDDKFSPAILRTKEIIKIQLKLGDIDKCKINTEIAK